MPPMVMVHKEDPKQVLFKQLGDISGFDLFHNQILVAVYMPPEQTVGGIIVPVKTRDENKFQGKVGLLVKKGPTAFVDPEKQWFTGTEGFEPGDWLVFRASDGWAVTINKVLCRIYDDTQVRARIQHPDQVW